MWMERLRKFRRDHRGLSLIELVCAVAILGIITTTVGGAMVVASDSYRRGTTESALQQEAQFTANTIESLIVDVTKEVKWDGAAKLEIINDSVTYTVTYDSTAQTLTYSDGTNNGVLIAEHVSGFNVYGAADFASTRNLSLSLSMKNGSSGFTTNYSITSRNNADAISSVAQKATIKVIREIVMEPNQTLSIPVTIMGPSGATFTCSSSSSDMTAAENGNNIDIELKNVAGKTDDFYTISVNAVDGGGNAITTTEPGGGPATIKVLVRRVRKSASGISLVSKTGTETKKDCVYNLKVNWGGSQLAQLGGNIYDYDYVDPYTQVWSYKLVDQSGVELNKDDYIQADTSASILRLSDFSFKLKEDLPEGSRLTVYATNLHSKGDDNGTRMNKTQLPYDDPVVVDWSITVESTSEILRGADKFMVGLPFEPNTYVKQMLAKSGYGFVQQYRVLYRFEMTGNKYNESVKNKQYNDNYPKWNELNNGGDQGNGFWIRPGDISGMDYMKDYKLQVIFRCYYYAQDDGNRGYWFPAGSDDLSTYDPVFDPSLDYMFEYPVKHFAMKFLKYEDGGVMKEVSSLASVSPDGTGIGSKDSPIALRQGSNKFVIKYDGGAAWKDGSIDNMGREYYTWDSATNSWKAGGFDVQLSRHSGSEDPSHQMDMSIVINNSSPGKVYKLVLTKVKDEKYSDDDGSGNCQDGVIYFTVH